jgi:hypothetical protein
VKNKPNQPQRSKQPNQPVTPTETRVVLQRLSIAIKTKTVLPALSNNIGRTKSRRQVYEAQPKYNHYTMLADHRNETSAPTNHLTGLKLGYANTEMV